MLPHAATAETTAGWLAYNRCVFFFIFEFFLGDLCSSVFIGVWLGKYFTVGQPPCNNNYGTDTSVADPGCFIRDSDPNIFSLWIPDPNIFHPGSWIPDPK
jgi:hypothetical protein